MTDTEITSDQVKADGVVEPIKIQSEDLDALKEIQAHVDALTRYRQEMGRLVQLIGNMRVEANRVEDELAGKRRSLADKYNLEQIGVGQWALDFEAKEFVKTAPGTPVIP